MHIDFHNYFVNVIENAKLPQSSHSRKNYKSIKSLNITLSTI